jgi:hypothetical protein
MPPEATRHIDPHLHHTTPMMRLQDSERTKVIIVTLAETTPVLEAAHLQEELRRAGIEPWAWLINNSLSAAPTSSPLLRQRAVFELAQIEEVRTRYAARRVPMQAEAHYRTVAHSRRPRTRRTLPARPGYYESTLNVWHAARKSVILGISSCGRVGLLCLDTLSASDAFLVSKDCGIVVNRTVGQLTPF